MPTECLALGWYPFEATNMVEGHRSQSSTFKPGALALKFAPRPASTYP